MPQRSRAPLDALRSSAVKLNQITDRANETVGDIEDFLAMCSPGTRTLVGAGTDPNTGESLWLEYRKYSQDFRVVVVSGDPTGEPETKPWSECSREIKLRTIAALPRLVEEIKAAIDFQLTLAREAEKAIVELHEMLFASREGA